MVSGMAQVNKTLSTSYYSYVNSVLNGDFISAGVHGELVLGALVNHSVITGNDGVAESIAASLEKEKQDLVVGLGGSGKELVSDEGFYFFRGTDGYEKVFNTSALEELTPSGLAALAKAKPEDHGGQVIGRYVHGTKWYVAMPADEATCLLFSIGRDYEVTFPGEGGKSVMMLLEKACIGDGGDGYLLFSSRDLEAAGNFDSQCADYNNSQFLLVCDSRTFS
jgi:hypothetical protein